jgi:plastocyanin
MKKITILFIAFFAYSATLTAGSFTVTISGTMYDPDLTTVNIGDNVTISASTMHPLVQVDKATWLINGATPMTGGWGTKTATYVFNATAADTIYFVCGNHHSLGMKGRIIVQPITGIKDLSVNESGISLYPNPVSSAATLLFNKIDVNKAIVNVYDITGQMVEKNVLSGNGSFSRTIDVSTLNNGIYFIAVLEGDNKYVKKFSVIK